MSVGHCEEEADYEYFLIEYRKTPASGYGSAGEPYDGLALYHVFRPSLQRLNPPLLKLEPADGVTVANGGTYADDFFAPENPAMNLSQTFGSYLTGQPVLRLANVTRSGSNMMFDVQILGDGGPIPSSMPNLVQNASFETGSTAPSLWTPANTNLCHWTTQPVHTGTRSVSASSPLPVDLDWRQTVSGLLPTRTYLLCGWIKGDNIVRHAGLEEGGGLTVSYGGNSEHIPVGYDTFDWREGCMTFRTDGPASADSLPARRQWQPGERDHVCDDLSVRAPLPAF